MSGMIGPWSNQTSACTARGSSTQWAAVRNTVGDRSEPVQTCNGTRFSSYVCISATYG